MKLLIDDVRTPESLGQEFDVVAKTYSEGCRAIDSGEITELWLDNDLGEFSPRREGFHILIRAIRKGLVPDIVRLVTANPIAKRRMEEALKYDTDLIYLPGRGSWVRIK